MVCFGGYTKRNWFRYHTKGKYLINNNLKTHHTMKTINSTAVRNEVANMQQTPVKVGKMDKGTLMLIVYLASAVAVVIALNSFGLIPA